jgi:hypothetical protein
MKIQRAQHEAGGARAKLLDLASWEGATRLRTKEAVEVADTRATRCNADRGRSHLSLPTEDEKLHTQRQALTKASRLDNDTHQGEWDQPTRRVSLGFTALVVLRILLLRRLLN